MGSGFEIRNIRKFDDDLKRICACYAARVESMENIPICAPRRFCDRPRIAARLPVRQTPQKYFADYRDVSACSGVERRNLPPAEADANTFAAALIHVWNAAVAYWRTMHRKSRHKCQPK